MRLEELPGFEGLYGVRSNAGALPSGACAMPASVLQAVPLGRFAQPRE